jgi:hypothetical protein
LYRYRAVRRAFFNFDIASPLLTLDFFGNYPSGTLMDSNNGHLAITRRLLRISQF